MWHVQMCFTISMHEIELKALKAPLAAAIPFMCDLQLVYMVYMEEDGSQHRGDSPTLFEKCVSSLKSLVLG